MKSAVRKYGFALAVAATLALAGGAIAFRSLSGGEQSANAGAGPARPGGGPPAGGPPGGGRGGEAPTVRVVAASEQTFYDVVRAIGTAQARESIVITPKVQDVIRTIRFESGDRVRAGQVLVELANVEQTAELAEAKASLEVESREYERFQELAQRGFAPAARVEAARAAHERALARVQALESRIADRTIRAPFAGVVGLRTASPGALARPGEPIGTLDDISTIKLDFDVPEPQVAQMRPGAALVATTAAFPGETFTGRIDVVDTRVDPQSRTLKVRALLPNRDGRLKPGMLMSVEVRANPREALAAPEVALLERIDGAYVLRVVASEEGDRVEQVRVSVGQRFGGQVEILDGLAANDRVIVEGVQRARPGQRVTVEAAATAPPPAASGPANPTRAPG